MVEYGYIAKENKQTNIYLNAITQVLFVIECGSWKKKSWMALS